MHKKICSIACSMTLTGPGRRGEGSGIRKGRKQERKETEGPKRKETDRSGKEGYLQIIRNQGSLQALSGRREEGEKGAGLGSKQLSCLLRKVAL